MKIVFFYVLRLLCYVIVMLQLVHRSHFSNKLAVIPVMVRSRLILTCFVVFWQFVAFAE
jgi:hypothetical protein